MAVGVRGEIEVSLARHDNMHAVFERRNGEPVRRVHAGLRGDQNPRANAGVRRSGLKRGKQAEQQESANKASFNKRADRWCFA